MTISNTKNVSVVVDRKEFLINRILPGIMIIVGGVMTLWSFIQSIGLELIAKNLGL